MAPDEQTPDERASEPVRELDTPVGGGEVVDGDAGDEDQAVELDDRAASDREPTDADAPPDDDGEQQPDPVEPVDRVDPTVGDVV
jgi:hypothetical protein